MNSVANVTDRQRWIPGTFSLLQGQLMCSYCISAQKQVVLIFTPAPGDKPVAGAQEVVVTLLREGEHS